MGVFQASEKDSVLVLSHLASWSARLTGGGGRSVGIKVSGS